PPRPYSPLFRPCRIPPTARKARILRGSGPSAVTPVVGGTDFPGGRLEFRCGEPVPAAGRGLSAVRRKVGMPSDSQPYSDVDPSDTDRLPVAGRLDAAPFPAAPRARPAELGGAAATV